MGVTWRLQTRPSGTGAIAVIALDTESPPDLDAALARLGAGGVAPGRVAVRKVGGVDQAVVARWSSTQAHVMPHAGIAVVRAITGAMLEAGIAESKELDPPRVYPEAASVLEAHMLAALARAASPLAIDLLLDQPRRWADTTTPLAPFEDRDRALCRLIDPPLVVALGPPNIGKSTLVNALAGRAVSLVADQPGTTRDHVGVTLECAGLVIRYADTPGLRDAPADPIESAATRLALDLAARADLVLLCGDASGPPPENPGRAEVLRVATRADLGIPAWTHDLAVCVPAGRGLEALVARIRDTLVPPLILADPAPWRFWHPGQPPGAGA